PLPPPALPSCPTRRSSDLSLRDNPAGLATSLCPDLEPVARRMRGATESAGAQVLKSALFFALTVAAIPFTLLEAAGAAGSTIMIDRKSTRLNSSHVKISYA